ncbi:MAG: chemotaxis protein CheD [Planctomycetia bacterium]|nr:chemotaxis protein CheD [Planctomycetia bacterium]
MPTTTITPKPAAARSPGTAREEAVAAASVGMGQIALLSPDGVGTAVLGSCVGLTLYDPNLRYAAMAHIVLPSSDNRTGSAGKFADTALDAMVAKLRAHGIDPSRLTAKLTGGASMFESKGPFQIGKQNVDAVVERLAALRIRLLSEHVGGTHGRRVTFQCRTGSLLVEVLGSVPITI